MKPTGLPPLALPPESRRTLEVWLQAACERVRREATIQCHDRHEAEGRVDGAKRLAEWLLSSLPASPVAE